MRELSAQDLATVNDLLAAQLRAGLPMESSLRAVAADWPGRAGSVLRDLSEQLERGEDLETAIARSGDRLPPEYVALVRAGQRTGRTPEVLDELTALAQVRVEARRLAVGSFVYPVLVAITAMGLGLLLWTRLIPAFYDDLVDSRAPIRPELRWIAETGRSLGASFTSVTAAIALGAIALAFVIFAWRIGPWAERHTNRLPFFGRAWRDLRLAYWTRLVALLLEHEVPEADAIELAARSLGHSSLEDNAHTLADTIRAGGRPSAQEWQAAGVPTLAAWAVAWSGSLPARLATLRNVSDTYDRRARRKMALASRMLPIVALAFVGGIFTLAYGLLVFVPLSELYQGLG